MPSLFTVMGLMALAGGSVGFFSFAPGLQMGIKMFINLAENGMVFPMYMNPPFRARSTFHLYAVKNPREVLKGGRMSFELKGPYVFETMLTRDKIAFVDGGERVAFDSGRKLILVESQSANMDEKLWLVNPILPSTSRTVKSMIIDRVPFKRLSEPIVFNSVNLLLDTYKERLLMRLTPREILDGRKIELLESLTALATRFGLAGLLPPGPPENKFGLAFVQNHTIDPVEIYTGVGKTKERFAEVTKFRGSDKMKVWRGRCNTIEGTNGELYKPFIRPGSSIRVFLNPLCRSFWMDPVGMGGGGGGGSGGAGTTTTATTTPEPVMTASGIRALEYEFSRRLYQGARSNPTNLCYCENSRTYDCQYDGLITMGPCFFDSPLFFTKGNFMGVNPKIRELVDWESAKKAGTGERLPDRQVLKIEQITGTVLEANVTLVALFKVVRQPYMRDIANVQNLTYAPLFATTETITLPFKAVWQIYFLQLLNDNHKMIMGGTAAAGAGLLTLKYLFSWL